MEASGNAVAGKVAAGKVAAGRLSGEAARHRAHRATLMGAAAKQQPAIQVSFSPISPITFNIRLFLSMGASR